jgi:hypothetical protein
MANSATENVFPTGEGAGAVALLQRRDGMSGDLFSRYWRDVHGVLATRIPGFTSYRQYHIERVAAYSESTVAAPMELDGIAEVLFAPTQADAGLVDSRIADFIRADERNVFSRAYLYNLPAGASRIWSPEPYDRNEHLTAVSMPCRLFFLLFQQAQARPLSSIQLELDGLLNDCRRAVPRMQILHSHLLAAGDTSWWDTPGVDNGRAGAPFVAAVKIETRDDDCVGDTVASLSKAIGRRAAGALGTATLYRVTRRYVMVHEGEPTEIGLRGLDAFRTIGEAQADNQRAPELLRSLYRYP